MQLQVFTEWLTIIGHLVDLSYGFGVRELGLVHLSLSNKWIIQPEHIQVFNMMLTTDVGLGNASAIAGGMFITEDLVTGKAIMGGMLQGTPDLLIWL